jgi:uncharacterized repeat protein (TIGR01451 family)
MEYPTVADVDSDGQAEILIAGAVSNSNAESTGYYEMTGALWIFKSDDPATRPWAPARKVWSQYAYNSVVINENLTIPAYQLNPATIFPGEDGLFGTADDVQPFNNFLQQQTILNKNGTPLWLAPRGIIANTPGLNYDITSDSITITVDIYNGGNAAFQAPFHITAYHNSVGGSPSYTYQHNDMIMAGDTAVITFGIPDFIANWYPFDHIAIQINDNGNGFNHQDVCDSTQRYHRTSNIIASDDKFLVFKESTNTSLDVITNDILPTTCSALTIQVINIPLHGSASVSGSNILYTPNTGATGDTLRYSIHCGDVSKADTATVYINLVNKPDNVVDVDCWVEPEAQEWMIQKFESIGLVKTYAQFLVGDMNDDGFPDIVGMHGPHTDANPRQAPNKIKIFYGPDFTVVDSITGIAPEHHSFGAIGKIKVGEPNIYESLIFYRNASTNRLYAVRADGTSPWANGYVSCNLKGIIGLADFNGDGWTEVYVGNKIFDAATGKLLADGGSNNSGKAALMTTYSGYVAYPQAIDILGDANLELVAGNKIYKVEIDRSAATAKTLEVISSVTPPAGAGQDGVTVVADFNNDGKLEVLVRQRINAAQTGTTVHLYLWSPHTGTSTGTLLANTTETVGTAFFGIPFVGDIDGDGRIEIVTLISNGKVESQTGFRARKYNEATKTFTDFWNINHIDQSGGTGMTLFDFNLDGIAEIVYRDEYELRIINGSKKSHITGADTTAVYALNSFKSYSATGFEYPVVVDIYGNGSSAILVAGDTGETRTDAKFNNYTDEAYIDIFTSDPATPWAPARKVWNQYCYNPVNVNEDLTIPNSPMNIATVFAGEDGILGTADDVRPYNNIMQQQTLLNKDGVPVYAVSDATLSSPLISNSITGDSVSVTIGIINQGSAALGSPVYATLYKESISAANKIATGTLTGYISPKDTGYLTVEIPDITLFQPIFNLIIHVNDDGAGLAYQPECDDTNNELTVLSPFLSLLMKKEAKLNGTTHNGTHANPVSVLFNENIEYTITATNVNTGTGSVIIRDTLPPHLNFVSSTPSIIPGTAGTNPPRVTLEWTIGGISSMGTTSVVIEATPHAGCCSSQPMFNNQAWVLASDTILVPTNYTYHQGACVGFATFSAGFGGTIYNAAEQALDYKTSPRPEIVIVPDEGYQFTGWSHDDYISLRGERIPAQESIMHYDTLIVYGNVNLHANFETEEYAITYYLNDSRNAKKILPSIRLNPAESFLMHLKKQVTCSPAGQDRMVTNHRNRSLYRPVRQENWNFTPTSFTADVKMTLSSKKQRQRVIKSGQ